MGQLWREARSLLGFLSVSFAAASVGGALTSRTVKTWYRGLRTSRLNPPNWVFGPVWTALYAMIATSGWLVWRGSRNGVGEGRGNAALSAWGVQLGLNVLWSGVFFAARSPGAALGVIAALWASIAVCVGLSARVSAAAAGLLGPYLAWTTFASYLNLRVWQLNRRQAARPWEGSKARLSE
jgi:translocator protein